MGHRSRRSALVVAGLLLAGCSSGASTSSEPAVTDVGASVAATTTFVDSVPDPVADFVLLDLQTRPGPEQVAVIDAAPGTALELVDDAGERRPGTVDEQGSLLWRQVEPGEYQIEDGEGGATNPFTVPSLEEAPDQSYFDAQQLDEGFGYITTRDGTTLSANVALPGPLEEGPYPTVVEYSGYTPSDPDDTTFAQLYTGLGFAYVGVNIRGTGCSGGSFQFFEPIQGLDGYDVIETVAAQDWVLDHEVGMVGISYPGISQLFVARTQPPHLAAITPLSVLDDSYRATLYPGGILNTGFAVAWTAERQSQAEPYGQGWTKDRADAGDTVCAENQRLRLQNPDQLQLIEDHPFDDPDRYDDIAPATFVDDIDVPVFLAGAWQDEQTGGHFPEMLDRFTSSPHLYATLVNGLHTESISLGVLTEYIEFLQLYVAKMSPDLSRATFAAPVLAKAITGVDGLALPPSSLEDMSYEEALAAFEARPPIRVLFEEGAADGTPPGSPLPRFEARFDEWPVPSTDRTWYLNDGEQLGDEVGAADAPAASYVADPEAVPATWYSGSSDGIWRADVVYDWRRTPDANAGTWTSAPLTEDTTVVGSGSVDLWLRSTAPDTDLEATITEIRPDGTETYVQSGWLRASHRALLDPDARVPVPTHQEGDAAPLPSGEFTEVRVALFPVGHAFRAGSQIRLTVSAPGGDRPVWVFDTISAGETNEIGQSSAQPSALHLPVVTGVDVPPGVPACGSLRGQPCRPA